MAHFSEIDNQGYVLRTIVVHNDVITDENGDEQEQLGIDFLSNLFPGTWWKQCSYNASFRKNYPGKGSYYSPEHDAFIPKSPYPSWVFDEDTCNWKAPKERPTDKTIEYIYRWDEPTLDWVKFTYPVPE